MKPELLLGLCAGLTLLFAIVGVVLSIIHRKNLTSVVRILGVCVFLMLLSSIYPYYAGEVYALGMTLFESMCAMLLNASAGDILTGLESYDVVWLQAYKSMVLVILIIAPLFTVGITLSFFADKFNRILYRIRAAFRDSYLFSAINERTLCIAEDIAQTHKKAVIVFVLRVAREDVDAEAMVRIQDINACIIADDITQLAHGLRHKRNYYLLSTDSGENLEAGLRLYQRYNGRQTDKVNMWLYSKNELAEVIFDQLYETFNVRLINEEGLIARAFVTEHPLYEGVQEGHLSVLLVGAGNIGLEILRNVAICSCLGGDAKPEINVIDLNGEKAGAVFEKTSPKLAERFGIRFHSADIKTAGFSGLLDSIAPTYIIVSLGSEALNLETALYIRRRYGIQNGFPRIHVLVDHKNIEERILPNLRIFDWKFNAECGQFESTPISDFGIEPFGSYEDTYKGLRIGASYRDCLAVAVNAVNRGMVELDERNTAEVMTDLYNQVCFYRDFADSYAVSIPYKLYTMGLRLVEDEQGDLSALVERLPGYSDTLRRQENRRFEAFMRSKGWRQMLPEEVVNGMPLDKLTKKHARLDDRYTEAMEQITGRDFEKEGLRSVMNLPTVIRLANALYGRNYSVRSEETIGTVLPLSENRS